MTENEFILQDRIAKIKATIEKYGEENFYLSFSGGFDSTVIDYLLDLSLPNNNIPRVFADTGIELNIIRDFVNKKAERDKRVILIKPSKNIRKILEENGYPFKSKRHSRVVDLYQRKGATKAVKKYLGTTIDGKKYSVSMSCPQKLKYQFFDKSFNLKISDKCCFKLKEEPLKKWSEENKKPIAILGIMRDEGGRRFETECLSFRGNKLYSFNPLSPVTKDFEKWLVETYKIEVCEIYKYPYNFARTGCKGCPFNVNLEKDLKTIEKYFPEERKQCEIIWKPVYDEYRRINFRLK